MRNTLGIKESAVWIVCLCENNCKRYLNNEYNTFYVIVLSFFMENLETYFNM